MPDRKVHVLANTALVAGLVPAVVVEPGLFPLLIGSVTGFLVHPDLDCSRDPFWFLYAKTHKHRGSSHWPVMGTAVRAVYLLWPIALAFWLAGVGIRWESLALWFVGLCASDMVHELLDIAT